MSLRSGSRLFVIISLAGLLSALTLSGGRQLNAVAGQAGQSPEVRGATETRLADGRWLVAGGESAAGVVATAHVIDRRTGVTAPLAGLQVARAAHTATLLADGTVLVAGGRGADARPVATAEIFDPQSNTFAPVTIAGALARMDHTATLLTDGRVLIAGGSEGQGAVGGAEIWDVARAASTAAGAMMQPRARHEAQMLADGRVRVSGGVGRDGVPLADEVFDPQTGAFTPAPPPTEDQSAPTLSASLPESGSLDVPLDVRIALRFSEPLLPDSVSTASITMSGSDGPIDIGVVPAEQGRLVFVSPRVALVPDTTYVVNIDGAVDRRHLTVASTSVTFTTREGGRSADVPDQEAWMPDGDNWRSGRPDSPWRTLKPLEAPPGVTGVAGQVLRLDGRPLADVTLTMEGRTARTDHTGRFLLRLDGLTTGEHTLAIDARTANKPNRTYGFYEVRWKLTAGGTNVLPFTIWSSLIDTAHQVTIPSPTTQETVITTPTMPGLELHLPAGTTIRDEEGHVARTVSITPIPLDRTPFPLPPDATFTRFFTIQPGGAYLDTPGPIKGGWLVYPPARHAHVGQRVQFFNYDPDDRGWYVYGMGTAEAMRVVPDARTRLYGFTGASFNDDNAAPPANWNPPGDCCRTAGDPVDLATGIFSDEMTDVAIPDAMPLALTRTYNSQDVAVRAFGRGTMDPYRIFLYTEEAFVQADLILPDGARIHYVRTSDPALPWYQTTFASTSSPTAFYQSTIVFDQPDNGWHLRLPDGTVYVFGHGAPLQAIRDPRGNETRLTWSTTNFFGAGTGNLLRVTSPNGRWLAFSYSPGSVRVSQVTDNLGRTWSYGYDANENLTTVTDPLNHTTTYLYNAANQMTGVRPRNLEGTTTNLVTNEYTTTADAPTPVGWVKTQTHADGGVYAFTYTVSNGKSTDSVVTDPRGLKRRLTFNSDGYTLTDTRAGQDPAALTTISARSATGNFITTSTDTINGQLAQTVYVRDTFGNATAVTRCLAGQNPCTDTNPGALTTRYTYDPRFQNVATVTDPLNHTTTYAYDDMGNLTSVTDPLQHQTTFAYNSQGQITSVTDALQHTTTFEYAGGDLKTITDPLTHITRRFTDAAGRLLSATDPLGQITRYTYDPNDHVLTVTDALNGQTVFTYKPDGQLETVTDANQHTTSYTYDVMQRLASRTDPLQRREVFTYDLNGNPETRTDRKGQLTTRAYDAFDRLHQVTYDDASTATYTYDERDRVTEIADSVSGTIGRTYDDFDRLTSETTPQGAIGYTYDDAGRRQTMTVQGQPQVVYTYDEADRLTGLTRDALAVGMTYDNANRRATLTLPNGIVTEYGYDDSNEITTLTYRNGATALGDLTYTHDPAGRRKQIGGSWARTGLPQAVASANYDPANELTTWASQTSSYDPSGNLASDGLTSYSWNARNELTAISGLSSAAFQYDAVRRRSSKIGGGQTVQYLYDGGNSVQQVSNGVAFTNALSSMALDETWSWTDALSTRFPLTDGLGSTLTLTDVSGAALTQYTYDPFGKTQASGTTATHPMQFTGRENDASASDLYFYRARYLSTTTQRFISEDPIEFAGGINLYAYVHDDPINFDDPSGTCDCSVRVRCRPAFGKVANFWHCYIVVKTRQGEYRTLTGGHDKDWMLAAWDLAGDPVGDNSFSDREYFYRQGAAMCDKVDCLRAKVPWVNGLRLQYHTFTQNSNSFVSWAMQLCGLPVNLPWWASGRDQQEQ